MRLATNNQWTGPISGFPIDGVDMWDAITNNDTSKERKEMVFYVDSSASAAMIQHEGYRYYADIGEEYAYTQEYTFDEDQDSSLSYELCPNPSLMHSDSSTLYDAFMSLFSGASYRSWIGATGAPVASVSVFLSLGAVVAMVTLVSRRYSSSGAARRMNKYERLPETDQCTR
jgi:hypothetical protein